MADVAPEVEAVPEEKKVAEEAPAQEEPTVEGVVDEEEDEAELEVDLDALPKMKVSELKDILKALDLPISGIKTTLIERIQEHFANEEADEVEPAAEAEEDKLLAEEELLKENEPEKKKEETKKEKEAEEKVEASVETKINLTDDERKKLRAEKFGAEVPEVDKKEARAAKFGILTEKSNEAKKEARAQKFSASPVTDDKKVIDEKKAARAARFNNGNTEKLQVSNEDKNKDEEKLKKRAARFEVPEAKVIKYDIEEVLKDKKEKTGNTSVELKVTSMTLEERKKMRALKFGV